MKELIKIIRLYWRRILASTIILTVAASLIGIFAPRSYESTVQLFVTTQVDQTNLNQQLLQSGDFATTRVKSYVDLATSPTVLQPVINNLALPTTSSQLANDISATAATDTVIMSIAVTSGTPEQAAQIANAVGSVLSATVSSLETPTNSRSSPVRLTVLSPAIPPNGPSSPNVPLVILLGVLIGLLASTASAILQERLDTSVKSKEDLIDSGVPLMGAINYDKHSSTNPLIDPAQSTGRAEAFKQLRTNLQFAAVNNAPRTILITSSFPGEGKSTTASNLAISLAATGLKICLVDADLRAPRQASYFGVSGEVGLSQIIIGKILAKQAVQHVRKGLDLICSGVIPPNPSELLTSERLAQSLNELSEQYDFIIVDSAPVLPVADTKPLAAQLDATLVVVRAAKTPRDALARTVGELEAVGANVAGGVLNAVSLAGPDGYGYGYGYGYGQTAQPTSTPPFAKAQAVNGESADTDVYVQPAARPTPGRRAR